MLRSLQNLTDAVILATDGEIGSVDQFYFDDEKWTVRYLVVKTGSWIARKKVLISPIAVQGFDRSLNVIRVSLTRKQVEESPDLDTDKPVSRQMEAQFHDYYRWPYYWTGAGVWGIAPYPGGMIGRPYPIPSTRTDPSSGEQPEEKGDPHLRSSHTVRGYGIEATDRRFGHVEDFIFDDESWTIRYLVIDTVNFWPSKSVLVSPEWVGSISWADRKFRVNLTEEQIKNSPEFRPDEPINREYEERLYDYYGRPRYWSQDSSPGLGDAAQSPGRFVI